MAQQKRGLGRGLGALIPTAPGPTGPESHASEPAGAPMAGSVAGVREQQTDGTYFDEIAIGAPAGAPAWLSSPAGPGAVGISAPRPLPSPRFC